MGSGDVLVREVGTGAIAYRVSWWERSVRGAVARAIAPWSAMGFLVSVSLIRYESTDRCGFDRTSFIGKRGIVTEVEFSQLSEC